VSDQPVEEAQPEQAQPVDSQPADLQPWRFTAATARGSAHDRLGTPNQDAYHVEQLPAGLVVALADGHGGARYVRSDVGAQAAVRSAVELVVDSWPRVSGSSGAQVIREEIVPGLVRRWQERVRSDHAGRAFSAEEERIAGAGLDADPLIAYGATLLLVIATDRDVYLCQLGDGDILVVRADSTVFEPVPGDDRLSGGATTSLCLPTAAEDFRIAVVAADEVELLLLATDGYGNAFADPGWRGAVGADFLRLIRDRKTGELAAHLPGWVAESAQVGGDDVSVAVVWPGQRSLAGQLPGTDIEEATARASRRGFHRGALAGWLILAVVLGAALGAAGMAVARPGTRQVVATRQPVVKVSTPTTLPSASSPRVVEEAAPTVAALIGPAGQIVVLRPVPGAAHPRNYQTNSDAAPQTALLAADRLWQIEDRQLQTRTASTPAIGVALRTADGTDLHPVSLTVAGPELWLLCEDNSVVAVDLSSSAQISNSNEPVQP
jgi:Protein phosphatase 2C